jgi:hypothetical protein
MSPQPWRLVRKGEGYVVDQLLIPNIHPQLIPAINMTVQVDQPGAVRSPGVFLCCLSHPGGRYRSQGRPGHVIEVRIGFRIGGKELSR